MYLHLGRHVTIIALAILLAAAAGNDVRAAVSPIPTCRLDNSNNKIIQLTLKRAIDAYAALNKALPIAAIAVNPPSPSTDGKTLDVYVVKDAANGTTDAAGCASRIPSATDSVDPISVRGGCIITAVERMELRCSSSAVDIFATAGRD